MFLGFQGRPRQPLKTREGSQEAFLDYSGPSWAILGPSWDQELFRNPRPDLPVPRARHLGSFWGPFWGPKLDIFVVFLESFLGPVLGDFLEDFGGPFVNPFS